MRLTQVPEQLVNPDWHDTAHLLPEQTSPALQALPQAPQLALSVLVLTHRPAQLNSPAWHDRAH